jgi:hypothetical protein
MTNHRDETDEFIEQIFRDIEAGNFTPSKDHNPNAFDVNYSTPSRKYNPPSQPPPAPKPQVKPAPVTSVNPEKDYNQYRLSKAIIENMLNTLIDTEHPKWQMALETLTDIIELCGEENYRGAISWHMGWDVDPEIERNWWDRIENVFKIKRI